MNWTERERDWYYAAIKANDYPKNVINFIEPFLGNDYTMLDVGCGIGTFALPLSRIVKRIIGVDYSQGMLDYLKKLKSNLSLDKNIQLRQGDWNEMNFSDEITINSLITAYSGQEVVGNRDSILKMQQLIDDIIFFFVPGERAKHSFATNDLFYRLNREERKHRTCYEDIANLLDKWGIKYNLKHFQYNFGQPFTSFSEAVQFFRFHYHIKERENETLKSFLNDRLKKKGDLLWIDNLKKSTLFWWQP
jgi:SAM-dependent methyltransferase